MATCGACGEVNPAHARFCHACGSALDAREPAGHGRARKTVTIVFCDLSGSTGLGERLDPEPLRGLMESYFTLARGVLERHGGTVEKYIGDAVMAAFGVTTSHEDDALRAVRAAVELRDSVTRSRFERLARGEERLALRIGVSTGEVLVGDRAAGETFATGDAVNVAARLEQAAAPNEVIISEATRRLVVDAVTTEPLGPLELKGKREPVVAHRLLQVRPDSPGRARRLDLPLVGRAREQRLLLEAFQRVVADRHPYLFTVLGPAGVGKSRLVHEFVAGVRPTATVLRGRCLPYGDGITYWPIAEIVRDAASIRATDSREGALERLNGLLASVADDRLKIVELLAGAIGLGPSSGTPEETAWAVRRLLVEIASQRPLLVVVDDIHWAAAALLDLLEGAVDWIRDVPLMMLCVARQELLTWRPAWGGGKLNATSLLLEPLSDQECETLTGELLGGGSVPADVAQRVSEASEGNPLFVEEFVAMLVEEGRLVRDGGRWFTTTPLDDLEVPPTVSALLAARLDRLDDGERRLLEFASVQGKSFSAGALESLAAADDGAGLTDRLLALVRMELVRPDGIGPAGHEAFRFRHILLRDVAYARLPKAERTTLHGQYAAWLESVAGDRIDEYEEILGYHLEQAWRFRRELRPDDPQLPELASRAAGHLAAAGRRAQGRGDLQAAIALFERAVALDPPDQTLLAGLLVDLGAAFGERGAFEPALASLGRAHDVAASAKLKAPAAMASVELHRIRLNADPVGWTTAATTVAQKAIRTFETVGDDQGLARAWHLIGFVDVMRARADGMLEAFSRAIDYAVKAGDARLEADSRVWRATALFLGPTPVPEALAQCLAMLEPADLHAPTEAGIRAACAGLRAMSGDFEGARADVAKSGEITSMLGMSVLGAAYSQEFAMVEMLAGDVGAALRHLRHGFDTLERMGEIGFRSTSAGLLGYVLFDAGDPQAAAAFAERCRELAAPDDVFSQVLWRLGLARPTAAAGQIAEAVELLQQSVAIAATSDFTWIHGATLRNLGTLLAKTGRVAEGEVAIRQALDLYDAKGVTPFVAQTAAQLDGLRASTLEAADSPINVGS